MPWTAVYALDCDLLWEDAESSTGKKEMTIPKLLRSIIGNIELINTYYRPSNTPVTGVCSRRHVQMGALQVMCSIVMCSIVYLDVSRVGACCTLPARNLYSQN